MNNQNEAFKVYQASAGSGKTYTIIKEYLSLCLNSKAATSNYSQILAITFTNMAANEMKEKILYHLNFIINSDLNKKAEKMEADLIKELKIDRMSLKANAQLLFQKIIHDYSSFCVSTIDAFVQRLARSFAKDLKLPTQFNVSIDEDEVADAITERIGEQIDKSDQFLIKILEDFSEMRFDNEKSPKIANSIHDFVKKLFAEEAFQKNEQNHFEGEEQYTQTLSFIQGKIRPFEAKCKQFLIDFESFKRKNNLTEEDFNFKANGPCLGFEKNVKEGKYATLGERQQQVLKGTLPWYSKTLARRMGSSLDDLNKEFKQVFIKFLEYYQAQSGPFFFYRSQLNQLSLYVLRSRIKKELERYIGEEQIVHISEFNKRINEILGDFSVPFVYERLGEHFKHLFIDEFQDTSVLQWQNLIPLLDNTLSNNNMSMIVGDGKQSIYRWRNGEVNQIVKLPLIHEKPSEFPAFDDFENTLVSNFNFDELKCNYRSFKNIVEFNNQFFEFSANFLDDERRKVYVDENKEFDKTVSIKQIVKEKEDGFVQVELLDPKDGDEPMLERIKDLINNLIGKGFQRKDITILVRKNKIGSLIANYLNENNIEVVSAESILLKSSDKVQLIINSLDYLIHNDNPSVIASVLYYWNATHQTGFNGVVDGIFEQVNSIAKGETSMEEAIGLKPNSFKSILDRSYSLYDLCSALLRLYGFNTIGDAYINFLLDVVYKWQATDEVGIGSFLEYWERKKDKLSVLSGNADAVNIMTVHKSKGLEFNVVLYPFMEDNLDDKKNNSLWISPVDLGFEAIPNIEKVLFTITKESATWSKQTMELAATEDAKVRLDNMNVNYVAFTRPKQQLYVLSYQVKSDEKSCPLNAFLKVHPQNLNTEANTNSHVYQFGDPNTRKVEEEEKKDKIKREEVYHESTASEWFNKIKIDPNPSMFWVSKDDPMQPAEWGTFVHQVLSEVQQADDIDHALKPYLDAGFIDEAIRQKLKKQFEAAVHHPLIAAAFSPQAKVKNECDILSELFSIQRPDRYAELDECIYLLDYKTGKESKDHQKQLQEYIAVLKRMTNKPIKAYLVYLGDTVKAVPVSAEDIQLTINI